MNEVECEVKECFESSREGWREHRVDVGLEMKCVSGSQCATQSISSLSRVAGRW